MSNSTSARGNSFCILRRSSTIVHSDEPVSRSEHVSRLNGQRRRTEFKYTQTRAWSDVDIQSRVHGGRSR